jgi:hypothetical protein
MQGLASNSEVDAFTRSIHQLNPKHETQTLDSADPSVCGRDDNLWGAVHGVDLLAEPREDKLGT